MQAYNVASNHMIRQQFIIITVMPEWSVVNSEA